MLPPAILWIFHQISSCSCHWSILYYLVPYFGWQCIHTVLSSRRGRHICGHSRLAHHYHARRKHIFSPTPSQDHYHTTQRCSKIRSIQYSTIQSSGGAILSIAHSWRLHLVTLSKSSIYRGLVGRGWAWVCHFAILLDRDSKWVYSKTCATCFFKCYIPNLGRWSLWWSNGFSRVRLCAYVC